MAPPGSLSELICSRLSKQASHINLTPLTWNRDEKGRIKTNDDEGMTGLGLNETELLEQVHHLATEICELNILVAGDINCKP